MDDEEWLAERFKSHRTYLQAVAHRMLGSEAEAEDALQEAWLRLSRSGAHEVENLAGWLTTVVARVCLDVLRSRKSRPEDPLGPDVPDTMANNERGIDPEHEVMVADSVGPALLVVLDTLAPAERLAFVLHDMFAVSFDEIASILGRSPTAARQLASRARRRVQGASVPADVDRTREREVVSAFLAASRDGDFDALLTVLDPGVVLHADGAAVRWGVPGEVCGASAVASTFKGRAQAARLALVNGAVGAAVVVGGQLRVAFCFAISRGKVIEVKLIADSTSLGELDVAFLHENAPSASDLPPGGGGGG
jgi:RNA polymerase sigma-70 factor (ECF subfamily)